ncbi:cell division protein FtsZ, partial [Pseudomonas sp. MWU12-2534b]
LAHEFDAQLVDDNRRVLTDAGLGRIRDQLLHIYGSMDDRGIAPGSVAELRLFA